MGANSSFAQRREPAGTILALSLQYCPDIHLHPNASEGWKWRDNQGLRVIQGAMEGGGVK